MSTRHDWISWDQYQAIHDRGIRDYLDFFILVDALAPDITADIVRWDGTLFCIDGIEIAVKILQGVRRAAGRPQVRTRRYAYHVQRRIAGRVIEVFRYDNAPHFGTTETHHVHRFDENGDEILVQPLPGDWPTLSDVIHEAYEYWRRFQASQSP